MYGTLSVLNNANQQTLVFASKEDAEQFKKFANIYMEDSGACNGCGAYWVYRDVPVMFVEGHLSHFVSEVNREMLQQMLDNIIFARSAGEDFSEKPFFRVGEKDGALTFEFGKLPKRQRPTVGHMFRTLSSKCDKNIAGRVITDNGDTFRVIGFQHEGKDGKPMPDAEFIDINADQVMRIYDWMTLSRNERK